MELLQFRYFLEAARYENLTRAAEDLHIAQLPVEIIIQHGEIFFSKTDQPVCHVLSCNGKAIPQKFLFQTVQRNCIDILSVHDSGSKRR